jgi:acetyl esterase/lipase
MKRKPKVKGSVLSLLGLLGILSGQCYQPAKAADEGTETKLIRKKDLTYRKIKDRELQMDLVMPPGKGPFPAVLGVHGGGWRSGSRQDLAKLTNLLAQKGFVAATISYRLAPESRFPAQIHDVKAAVRWLRKHADTYKIDPKRIGAVGFSAGGHLVSLLGATDETDGLDGKDGKGQPSSRVQAVVSFFGPTDLINKSWTNQVEDFYLVPFLGVSYEKGKEVYEKASPLKYVTKDDPPFLFIHGDKDTLVGLHHSRDMRKKLMDVGVHAELMIVKGAGHGWSGKQLDETLDRTIQFFQDHLKK